MKDFEIKTWKMDSFHFMNLLNGITMNDLNFVNNN